MVKEISANLRVIIIIVQNRPNCFASLAIRSILDNLLPHLHWESNTLKKLNVISYRLMSLKAIKSRKLCSFSILYLHMDSFDGFFYKLFMIKQYLTCQVLL